MSVDIRNGKVLAHQHSQQVTAPTPAQIAERAYELATIRALRALDETPLIRLTVGTSLHEGRAEDLRQLRDSVINPGPIPWWTK